MTRFMLLQLSKLYLYYSIRERNVQIEFSTKSFKKEFHFKQNSFLIIGKIQIPTVRQVQLITCFKNPSQINLMRITPIPILALTPNSEAIKEEIHKWEYVKIKCYKLSHQFRYWVYIMGCPTTTLPSPPSGKMTVVPNSQANSLSSVSFLLNQSLWRAVHCIWVLSSLSFHDASSLLP